MVQNNKIFALIMILVVLFALLMILMNKLFHDKMIQNKKLLSSIIILITIISGIVGINALIKESTAMGIILVVISGIGIIGIIGFEQYMRMQGSQDYNEDSDPQIIGYPSHSRNSFPTGNM